MKVRAVRRFNDLSAGVKRAKGDEFDVSKKRAEELQATTFGVLVELVDPKAEAKAEKVGKAKAGKAKAGKAKPETPEDAMPEPETPEDAKVKPETASE